MTNSGQRKRPLAVTVVTIVNGVLVGLYLLGYTALLVLGLKAAQEQAAEFTAGHVLVPTYDALAVAVPGVVLGLVPTYAALAVAVPGVVLGLVGLVLLFGFVRTRWWAWAGFMVWAGFNLAVGLVGYALGQPDYPKLVIGVILVFALSQSEVREAFGIYGRATDELAADE